MKQARSGRTLLVREQSFVLMNRVPIIMILKMFSPKNFAKILALLAQTMCQFLQKLDHSTGLHMGKNANF
jgi:hypothetical protein